MIELREEGERQVSLSSQLRSLIPIHGTRRPAEGVGDGGLAPFGLKVVPSAYACVPCCVRLVDESQRLSSKFRLLHLRFLLSRPWA